MTDEEKVIKLKSLFSDMEKEIYNTEIYKNIITSITCKEVFDIIEKYSKEINKI